MATLGHTAFVGCLPWLEPHDQLVARRSTDISRGCLILPYPEAKFFCEECKDPLPMITRWADKNRQLWCKYELPVGDYGESSSVVFRTDDLKSSQVCGGVVLGSGIMRSLLDEYLDSEDGGNQAGDSLNRFSRLRELVDTHIEFINDLWDHVRSNRYYWEGNFGGLATRSVNRVVSGWINTSEHGNARMALIVKLAREIAHVLGLVCDKPRVVLRRMREFQNIARIQEIDSNCLRWLARQPGRDVFERAGSRQQLLGVVRKEHTDTLENQMVRDLLHRARVECGTYVSLNHEFSEHDRVRTVSSFRRQLVKWERHSDIAQARRLAGPVQPNYVLLHEPKYKKLWDAYQMLLAQQKQKDDIWRWRYRTFAESCEIGLISLMRQHFRRSQFNKSDVIFYSEAFAGRFVSTSTQLGTLGLSEAGSGSELVFCRGVQANQCPYVNRGFYPLAADLFLIARQGTTVSRTVPIWCLAECAKSTIDEGVRLLEQKLRNMEEPDLIRPFLLVYDEPTMEREFFDRRGRIVSVSFPLYKSMQTLNEPILNALGTI